MVSSNLPLDICQLTLLIASQDITTYTITKRYPRLEFQELCVGAGECSALSLQIAQLICPRRPVWLDLHRPQLQSVDGHKLWQSIYFRTS